MIKKTTAIVAFAALSVSTVSAQMPALTGNNGRHAFTVDGKPFFMLGGQAHNSSAWPALMPGVWRSATDMHLNTLEVPVYWEQVEPLDGKFDFSVVDTLLVQARNHRMRLVLLWFATWKNGSNHYMPSWMKQDATKYPNVVGKDGKPVDSPSPHADPTLQADKKAFAEMMRYLKKADPKHAVIMVQVENESGAWGSVRDYSPQAEQLFARQVPPELLKPDILKALNVAEATSGTWKQVFGERADEYFHAWSVAKFIGEVAAAGKAEYALPMYTNAALRDPLTNPAATQYESGGPTDNVLPIWKAAAPAIDILAPDIYLSGTERCLKVLELYDRPDNALFVPEAGLNAVNAKYFFEVLARGGIGFSPFGIDNNGDTANDGELTRRLKPYADAYAAVAPMLPELADRAYNGKIKSAVAHDDQSTQTIDLGVWQAIAGFGSIRRGNATADGEEATGKVLFVKLDDNTFLATGTRCHLTFKPAGNNAGKAWQYLKVEEGVYEKGVFKPLRILNGDETDWGGPNLGNTPTLLRISLVTR